MRKNTAAYVHVSIDGQFNKCWYSVLTEIEPNHQRHGGEHKPQLAKQKQPVDRHAGRSSGASSPSILGTKPPIPMMMMMISYYNADHALRGDSDARNIITSNQSKQLQPRITCHRPTGG